MKPLSLLGYLLMAAGILGLVAMGALFAHAPVAIAVQAIAVFLMIYARITFGVRSFHATANPTAGRLVTSGPYQFIRHPIYTALVLFAFAGASAHLAPAVVGLALLVLLGAAIRMHLEERYLTAGYREYAAYAARTKRMIPFLF
jgi:protein-S-isoprenylcysteine O-methyltransferase Ste14